MVQCGNEGNVQRNTSIHTSSACDAIKSTIIRKQLGGHGYRGSRGGRNRCLCINCNNKCGHYNEKLGKHFFFSWVVLNVFVKRKGPSHWNFFIKGPIYTTVGVGTPQRIPEYIRPSTTFIRNSCCRVHGTFLASLSGSYVTEHENNLGRS